MKEKPLAESGCVVVCNGKNCKKAGAGKLRKALEKAGEEAGAKLMVFKTGCLGKCTRGAAAAVWPKGVCFTDATVDDVAEILSAAGVAAKKKGKKDKKEKKGKAVKDTAKAAKAVKVKSEKKPKDKADKAKKEPKVKAAKTKSKKTEKIAPPAGESMTPEAHGYAE